MCCEQEEVHGACSVRSVKNSSTVYQLVLGGGLKV